MLFNSLHFLLFFPIVILLYFAIPHKIRVYWLLGASYYFYMSWNPKYAVLLAASTLITYLSGLLIDFSNKNPNENKRNFRRKLWVFLSFTSNLSILFFFKYFDFAVANINFILSHIGIKLLNPAFDVLLPIGISFYIFQALSYTMDIYRGEIASEKNIAKYALFVSFFPQLLAGPIERSKNLLSQMSEKHLFNYDNAKNGFLLMMWGYFQKTVVADRLSVFVEGIFQNYSGFSGLEISIAGVFFAFQIYLDFAGYSNISRGAGQIMGFRLMNNFNAPYLAQSIQDFWRRWHISLSTWFRDYLYIPLGGNRCGRLRKYFNTLIVFVVSGLWHGANWTYVVWGALHGVYQVAGGITKPYREKAFDFLQIDKNSAIVKIWRTLFVFVLVDIGWVFFRASSISAAIGMIGRIFSYFQLWIWLILAIMALIVLVRIIIIKKLFKLYFLIIITLLLWAIGDTFYNILVSERMAFVSAEAMHQEDFRFSLWCISFVLFCDIVREKIGSLRDWLEKQTIRARWTVYYGLILMVLLFCMMERTEFVYFQF
ncbi:MAG: MBOAT family protein [Elusimicrobiota bacterium]|jgi:D-alanyl-lipoteichoic acid acyltransferase DltB (MBOAT superfamily)|nr:MBOAT family protein [Elusimicrobiota bacterium]